ncbi:MAG: di-trans,poly-cis-decaprenylcistransferase [Candidatus Yanofskybacteria bacterium]|nr:di-trans,poly-cis-decaprenylcistransferase [Candidatus Yanofskybacteria bacterium]
MQQNLPQHVAIIPDGNRRWARLRGLPDEDGHREGRATFHKISKIAFNLGISYFTFWAMSEDNHAKRSIAEISSLVSLLKEALESNWVKELFENQIRFRVLGNWRELAATKHLASLIDELQWQTRSFNKHNLTVALGYGGEHEVVETIRSNIEDWHYWHPLASSDFERVRKAAFWTKDLPRVDLEIRTGETMERWLHNSSGFMMLHTTNSEVHISPTLWPDFSEQEFKKIIEEYGQRERKFGK